MAARDAGAKSGPWRRRSAASSTRCTRSSRAPKARVRFGRQEVPSSRRAAASNGSRSTSTVPDLAAYLVELRRALEDARDIREREARAERSPGSFLPSSRAASAALLRIPARGILMAMTNTLTYTVPGMSCGHCEAAVTRRSRRSRALRPLRSTSTRSSSSCAARASTTRRCAQRSTRRATKRRDRRGTGAGSPRPRGHDVRVVRDAHREEALAGRRRRGLLGELRDRGGSGRV